MSFQDSTRRKVIPLTAQAKGTTNPLQWDLPKTGFLAAIMLSIQVTITGTLSAPNAMGVASVIRKVRLITNAGIDLFNMSGAAYSYLLKEFLEDYRAATIQNQGQTAVTAASFNLDMIIPVALNARDPLGLFMLQNDQTLVQLQVEFESDAVVATGATVAATVTPFIEIFTVPVDPKDWPALNVVQQCLEDQRSISGAGDYDYAYPRGNTYVQVLHGYGIAVAPAEKANRVKVMVNQSEIIYDYPTIAMTMEYNRAHGRARVVGTWGIDFIGSSALGTLGSSRDLLFSALVTELLSRITVVTQPDTLYTVRRQLVALR